MRKTGKEGNDSFLTEKQANDQREIARRAARFNKDKPAKSGPTKKG